MATAGQFEAKVYQVEKIRIRILRENGSDVRSDMEGFNPYDMSNKAPDNFSVASFKTRIKRFIGPIFIIEVMDKNGNVVSQGNTLLKNIR